MNKLFFLATLISFLSFSQNEMGEDRFGVTLGATNYIMKNNFMSTKSSTGATLGLSAGVNIWENFEILTEIKLNYHRMQLLASTEENLEPSYIKASMTNFDIAVLPHYRFYDTSSLDLSVFCGVTLAATYNIKLKDQDAEYKIEPLDFKGTYLEFDTWNEQPSMNLFLTFGVAAQYNDFMLALRYNYGITDPYRKFPLYSNYVAFKGKDHYAAITVTYFFQ